MSEWTIDKLNRRGLLLVAAAAGATLAMPRLARAGAANRADAGFGGDLSAVRAAIEKQRPEAIRRLQNWIALPSIAAENRNMKEGCQMMMDLLRDAGSMQRSHTSSTFMRWRRSSGRLNRRRLR